MLPIDITLDNSIVVDSEWFVKDTSPLPALISYKSATLPVNVVPGDAPLPGGYKYYVSWYVGAERNKIPLPKGGQWICLASMNHATYFHAVRKAESLVDVCIRLRMGNLDKSARSRFVDECTDFVCSDREKLYARIDAEVTWSVFEKLMSHQLKKLEPAQFWSIIAHSNSYTYSASVADREAWYRSCEERLEASQKYYESVVAEVKELATPETCPNLDWSIMKKKGIPAWKNKKLTVSCNDFGYLLDIRDKDGQRLTHRPKIDGGWIGGNCKLFSKDMISFWERGDVVPGHSIEHCNKILSAIIESNYWVGIRGNLAETWRWNPSRKVFQDQTPKGAVSGRSTSKTCLLFPKDTTKNKIGFDVRDVYHCLPPNVYHVGFDWGAQEALILSLICLSLGDRRLYDRATNGRVHDDNASDWGVSRSDAKAGFFAALYGASAKKLQLTLGMSAEAATAVHQGTYGRGGICEKYLMWLKRNETAPVSLYYQKRMNVYQSGVHLQKNCVVQHTGNCMLDWVVATLHLEGWQFSQSVHDEVWFIVENIEGDPSANLEVQKLKARMEECYIKSWLKLSRALNLPDATIDLPCFKGEIDIVNVGLQKLVI